MDGTGPFASNLCEAGAFIRCEESSSYPDVQIHFGLTHGVNYYDGSPPDRHGFDFDVNLCRPQSRGTVRLQSADPLDRPLIDPRYLSEPRDLDLALKGLKKVLAIGNARTFSEVGAKQTHPGPEMDSDQDLVQYIRRVGTTIWHPVGTCKMGHDTMAVVDDELRVRGTFRSASRRCFDHADNCEWKHQCPLHHDRGKGVRPRNRADNKEQAINHGVSAVHLTGTMVLDIRHS